MESFLTPPDLCFEPVEDPAAPFTSARGVKTTVVSFSSSKASDTLKEEVPTVRANATSVKESHEPIRSPSFGRADPTQITMTPSKSDPAPLAPTSTINVGLRVTPTSATPSPDMAPSVAKATLEPPDPEETSPKPIGTAKAWSQQRARVAGTTYTPRRSNAIDGLPAPSTGGFAVAGRSKVVGPGATRIGGVDGLPLHREPGALPVGISPVAVSAIEAVRNYQLPPQAMRKREGVRARVAAFFRMS